MKTNEIEAQTKQKASKHLWEIRGSHYRKIPVTSELVSKTDQFLNGTAAYASQKSIKYCKY